MIDIQDTEMFDLDEGADGMSQDERIKHVLYLATFALMEKGGEVTYSREQVSSWLDILAGATTVIGVKSDEEEISFFLTWEQSSAPC